MNHPDDCGASEETVEAPDKMLDFALLPDRI